MSYVEERKRLFDQRKGIIRRDYTFMAAVVACIVAIIPIVVGDYLSARHDLNLYKTEYQKMISE